MSMRRSYLGPVAALSGAAMTGNLTSKVVDCRYIDNLAVQLSWTGTPAGNIQIQACNDASASQQGNITGGTWQNIGSAIAAGGAAGGQMVNLPAIGYAFVRVIYTFTSSTGALTVVIAGKGS